MIELNYEQIKAKLPVTDDDATSANDATILNDLLLFDQEYNIENNNGYGYYKGKSTDWTIKLRKITQQDIKRYVTDVNKNRGRETSDEKIQFSEINDIFMEARKVSRQTHENDYDATVGTKGIPSLFQVQGIFIDLMNTTRTGYTRRYDKSGLKDYVVAFDEYTYEGDNPNKNTVKISDLNKFASFYTLSSQEKAILADIYFEPLSSVYDSATQKIIFQNT